MKESQAIISPRIREVIRKRIRNNIALQIPISSNNHFSYSNFVRDLPSGIKTVHLFCQNTLTEKEYWLIERLLRMQLLVSMNINHHNIEREVVHDLKSIVDKIQSGQRNKKNKTDCKSCDNKNNSNTAQENKEKLHLNIRIEEKAICTEQIKEYSTLRDIGIGITLEVVQAEIEPIDNKKYIEELCKHGINYQYDNALLKQPKSNGSIDIRSMFFCTNTFFPYICCDGKMWTCPKAGMSDNTNKELKNGPLYRGDLKRETLEHILERYVSHLQLLITMIIGPYSMVNLLKRHKAAVMLRLSEEDKKVFRFLLNLEGDIYKSSPCSYLSRVKTKKRISDRMSTRLKIRSRNNNLIEIGSMCDICFFVNKYDFSNLIAKSCDTKTLDNAFYIWNNIVSRRYHFDDQDTQAACC